MPLCKGEKCKKYGPIYEELYITETIAGRDIINKYRKCVKRSCYYESGCWKGDIDQLINIFRIKRKK